MIWKKKDFRHCLNYSLAKAIFDLKLTLHSVNLYIFYQHTYVCVNNNSTHYTRANLVWAFPTQPWAVPPHSLPHAQGYLLGVSGFHCQGSPRVLSTRSPSSLVQLSSPSPLCGCSREFWARVMVMAQVHSLLGYQGGRRSKMERMLVCPLPARPPTSSPDSLDFLFFSLHFKL